MNNPLNLGTKLIIDSIREELNEILSNNLVIASHENPIEIENDLGKFKYEGNGRLLVQSKKGVEYLVLNVKIKPASSESEDL